MNTIKCNDVTVHVMSLNQKSGIGVTSLFQKPLLLNFMSSVEDILLLLFAFAVAPMTEQEVLQTYLVSNFHTCQSNCVGGSRVNQL